MTDAIIVTLLRLRPAKGLPCPFLTWLSACLGILAAGCDPELPGKPNPKDRPVAAEKVLAFDALYGRNCAGCHGKDGKLGPAPPLNDPLFLAIVPDAELHRVISAGRPGTPMPAFAREHGGTLTSDQVKVLADGLKPRWGQQGRPTEGVPSYRSPETLPLPMGVGDLARASNEAGEKVFARA